MDRRWLGPLSHFQLEDVAVFAIVLVTPFTPGFGSFAPILGGPGDLLGGLISFLAAVGAVIALLTRVPGETRLERPGEVAPERIWMIGPFVLAIVLVAGDSLDRMGLPGGNFLIGIAFVAVLVSLLLADRLPVVSRGVRRLLMTPFVLLATAFFVNLATDFASGFGEGTLDALLALEPLLIVQLLAILALAALPFYLALVFVPRELADPSGSARSWVARFAVFYVSLVLAITLGGASPVLAG